MTIRTTGIAARTHPGACRGCSRSRTTPRASSVTRSCASDAAQYCSKAGIESGHRSAGTRRAVAIGA
ncbi:hypothetical protein DEJ36_07995 [Curtobacterium sp. MCPF17_052]|nr:hypothetical protein [Curtobacterium sp. MCPF17_052]WIB13637.1 hypothetical protein DEJ36_07995 [Curtobacterium sp. MCPF17_052]